MKILLIQARDPNDPMKDHEIGCFLARTGIKPENMVVANSLETSRFPIHDVDAIFIGGSGNYSATEEHAWIPPVLDTIREIRKQETPLFGSCWGFHMIARAFGGKVVTDEARKELGTLSMQLTPEGKNDELFANLPNPFLAQLGHKDSVPVLPEDAISLVYNETYPNQALRIRDTDIYGTQFHPELNAEDMRLRLQKYIDLGYVTEEEKRSMEKILASFRDTPECCNILKRFIELYVENRR